MEKEKIRKKMIILQIVYVILILLGAFPSVLLGFISDTMSPTLMDYLAMYAFHIVILTFLFSLFASMKCFALGKYRFIKWLNLLPILSFIWLIFCLVYYS